MEIREELRYINQFAKTELTEDQVYVFTVRLCDNEVDRDFERFDTAALETLGEMFVGGCIKCGFPDRCGPHLLQRMRIWV